MSVGGAGHGAFADGHMSSAMAVAGARSANQGPPTFPELGGLDNPSPCHRPHLPQHLRQTGTVDDSLHLTLETDTQTFFFTARVETPLAVEACQLHISFRPRMLHVQIDIRYLDRYARAVCILVTLASRGRRTVIF